ncbi:hypothetical protein QQ73_21555 [Candidatus Endoriftia persephone str. Guaymas]|nr:hypothetical protein [Candidatus Endoriftia persephone str. Guaymas]
MVGTAEVDKCLVGSVDHGGKRWRRADKAVVVMLLRSKIQKGLVESGCAIFLMYQEITWLHLSMM